MEIKAIIELIKYFIKIIIFFSNKYVTASIDEKKIYNDKIKNLLELSKSITESNIELNNEKDFLSNLTWENEIRYKEYYNSLLGIFTKSGVCSYYLVTQIKVLGADKRASIKEKEIIEVVESKDSMDNKAKRIAKILLEV